MFADAPLLEPTVVAGRPAFLLTSHDQRVRATVVPDLAMLVSSLTLDGRELLGQPNSVEAFAARWATTGVPLLHPWANRLAGPELAGTGRPTLDTSSPLVPTDGNGLAIHGVNLADAGWVTRVVVNDRAVRVAGLMRFEDAARTALFPFAHELEVAVALEDHALRIATAVRPTGSSPVPVSFGWHPYFRIPGIPRGEWYVELPVHRRAVLDDLMIPTGRDVPVDPPAGPLTDTTYDDMFTELSPAPIFRLSGGGAWIEVASGAEYPIAQVYAPAGRDLIAFEPMTAPVNALVSGDGLRWVQPGDRFEATFTITVGGFAPA